MDPLDLIRPDVRALSAYHVQDARGLIKLDAMENPFPLPAVLRARLGERLAEGAYNRYPDAQPMALKALLRRTLGIPEGAEVLLGNGSDEIIQILAQAVARPGATLLGVEPAFVMFRMLALSCGLAYQGVALNADFSLDLDALLAAIRTTRPALIFLAVPNNPTGNVFPVAAIEAVLAQSSGLVVVDEAYFPFTDSSWLPRLGDYRRLLVMRTLSKLGLAGIRLGLLAGAPDLIAEFEKLRLPYNISVGSQIIATTVLESADLLWEQAHLLRAERSRLAAALHGMPGLSCFPSEANFLLVRVERPAAVFDALRQHGILIKNLSNAHELLRGCLRLTVGSPEQNDRLIEALALSLRMAG